MSHIEIARTKCASAKNCKEEVDSCRPCHEATLDVSLRLGRPWHTRPSLPPPHLLQELQNEKKKEKSVLDSIAQYVIVAVFIVDSFWYFASAD